MPSPPWRDVFAANDDQIDPLANLIASMIGLGIHAQTEDLAEAFFARNRR